MERTEAAVVLGAGLAQSDVALDYLDDVGLPLDGFGEVGHGEGLLLRIRPARCGGRGRRGKPGWRLKAALGQCSPDLGGVRR